MIEIQIVFLSMAVYLIVATTIYREHKMILNSGLILTRRGQYHAVLEKLGGYKILETPIIEELIENKSLRPKAYKELRELEEDIAKLPHKVRNFTVTEYFCYISAAFLINNHKANALKFQGIEKPSLIKWAFVLMDNFYYFQTDTKNLLRLYNSYSPFYVIFRSLVGLTQEISEEELQDQINCSALLSGFSEILIYEEMFGDNRDIHDKEVKYLKNRFEVKSSELQ